MKRILAAMFAGFLFLAAASYSAYAEMRGCMCRSEGMMHHPGGMTGAGPGIRQAFRGLGLGEQQKTAIKGIGFKLMKEAVRKKADIRIARIELRELLQKDKVDMAAVEAKLKQIADLQTSLRLSKIKAMEEIKADLTPAQRQKFRENFRRLIWMHKDHQGCMCDMGRGKMCLHAGGMTRRSGRS
ncbi:MAG: Spy/CpxP family protein refolding chaperone [Desulfobacteraceae bacterium]|nr:Spy/CpxP family protein refolding chaperone [Desulfobacteraceae bacterium]